MNNGTSTGEYNSRTVINCGAEVEGGGTKRRRMERKI